MKLATFLLTTLIGLASLPLTAWGQEAPHSAPAANGQRKVLLEVFTSERCNNCPDGHETLAATLGDKTNIIELVHHAGFYTDKFTIPESTAYEWFYKCSDYSSTFAPAFMMDRTHWDALPDYYYYPTPMSMSFSSNALKAAYAEATAVPALANIRISPSYDSENRLLSLDVEAEALVASEGYEHPALNVFLVENDVFSKTQTTTEGISDYTHQHVVRKCLTTTWGEGFEAGGTISRHYEVTLNEKWNAENMSVVAYVANYKPDPNNDYKPDSNANCRVMNAEEVQLCGADIPANALTVTSLTSNANDGIVLTFSEDVKVSHNIFGTKCYNVFTDKDGTPSSLNATPTTQGNVVTLAASYCTFVNGHHIHLELNPECFTTLDGATQLTGTTTFDFVMGDGEGVEPITAVQVAPSNGTLTHLGNIAVVFDPMIAGIVDPAGFSVVNEKGDALPILSVTIDNETPINALNVNIDTEQATLKGGTTYSLHIAPGALKCGTLINEKELVYGKWYIKPEPLTLVTNPPHQRMVESISQITISAKNGGRLLCTDQSRKDLCITGIMEDQSIVLATVKEITTDGRGSAVTFTLDKPINAENLAAAGAKLDFVTLAIPEGLFQQASSYNDALSIVWKIGTPKPLGKVTWNFTPRPGSTLESLGTPLTVEREDVPNYDVYTLRFSITGQDAYMTITDAQNIKIINADTGRDIKAFSRSAIKQEGVNAFMIVMESPIKYNGRYSLVIPAASINYYSDAEHFSAPQHPAEDVVATWTVNNPAAPILGDANGDNVVSIADIITCISALTNPDASDAALDNIDFDNDGKFTPADIQVIIDTLLQK